MHDVQDAVRTTDIPPQTSPADVPRETSPGRATIGERAASWARSVWLWPTLLMLALGLYNLGRPELWRDELRSWSASSRSIGEIVELLSHTDGAVALYYFVLHYWIDIFGDSAASMRMPSVLAMAASAGVVALIGRRLYNGRVGLIAGLLFAVVPNVSRFAQEVRPYAITMLAALVSTLLLFRAMEKQVWHRFVLYGLSITALGLTQLLALPLLAVHAVALLLWWRGDRQLLIRTGAAVLGGLVLTAPIIWRGMRQYDHQVGTLPDATIAELVNLAPRLFASGLMAGAIIGLTVIAFAQHRRPAIFAVAWAVIPIAAIWLGSQGTNSYWMTRYLLITLPGFVILAAAAIAAFRLPVVIAVVTAVAALGIHDQRQLREPASHDAWNYPDPSGQFIQYSVAARTIEENMQPGDGIAYAERWMFWLNDIGLAYHMQGKPMPRDVFVAQTALQRGDFWPVECTDYAACLRGEERIWIVSVELRSQETPYDTMEPEKAAVLRRDYTIVKRWTQGPDIGITLTLVVRNDHR